MHDTETTAPHVASESERLPIHRSPSISLILPAYNEAEVIADAINEADVALSQITDDYEIIVVDDGSTDQTASIVRELALPSARVRLVQHAANQGYGAGIRSGFSEARNDRVVFTDADCQFDLTELDRFAGEFHHKPIWYFVPVLLIAGHPWSFLTIPYAKFLFGRVKAARTRRPPAVGYLLLWSSWCFVFFSISACKLPTYLLPAAPAFALMLGHYLNEVLRESGDPTEYFFARFWSARTATATTCFAGVAFVLFVIVWTETFSISLFGWVMFWAMLLMVSLLLMGDRHQAKIAWASSSGVAFLLIVMMMHQMVPAYSRSQTIFGETSPLGEQLAVDEQSPIATVDHEFSEVPFYLNRSDIPNFADVHDSGLADFVSNSDRAILIVDDRIASRVLADQLRRTAKLTEVGRRGPALIYQATKITSATHMAAVPGGASKGTQR